MPGILRDLLVRINDQQNWKSWTDRNPEPTITLLLKEKKRTIRIFFLTNDDKDIEYLSHIYAHTFEAQKD